MIIIINLEDRMHRTRQAAATALAAPAARPSPAASGGAERPDPALACPLVFEAIVHEWIERFRRRHADGRIAYLKTRAALARVPRDRPAFVIAADVLEGTTLGEATAFFRELQHHHPRAQVALLLSRDTLAAWRLHDEHRFPCVFSDIWLVSALSQAQLLRRDCAHRTWMGQLVAHARALLPDDGRRFVLLEVG
jgi:hypothetical protein